MSESVKTTKRTKRKATSQAGDTATTTSSKKKKPDKASAKTAKKQAPVQGRGEDSIARDETAQDQTSINLQNNSKSRQRRTLTKAEKLNVVKQVETYNGGTLSIILH